MKIVDVGANDDVAFFVDIKFGREPLEPSGEFFVRLAIVVDIIGSVKVKTCGGSPSHEFVPRTSLYIRLTCPSMYIAE